MSESNQEMLHHAIARNSTALLSLPSAGMLRHHKTRFLAEEKDGFWIEAPIGERPLLDELIGAQASIGVAFKSQQHSVVFATSITGRTEQFAVNDNSSVEALLLPYPESFRDLQRRHVYRVILPMEHPVQVRIWRTPEHAVLRDRPMAAQEIHCHLRNLSVMGMGLVLPPKNEQAARVALNERIRITMKCQDSEVLMEGRLIHQRPAADNAVHCGILFKKLEKDLEGRQILSKLNSIVGQLQRDEICRLRAG